MAGPVPIFTLLRVVSPPTQLVDLFAVTPITPFIERRERAVSRYHCERPLAHLFAWTCEVPRAPPSGSADVRCYCGGGVVSGTLPHPPHRQLP